MYSQAEIDVILDGQKNNQTLDQIASRINKSPAAVRVYMYRNGIALKKKVKCPIVEKLISIKFADPSWFRPNRAFYSKVQISQKRFSDLRLGYANPTDAEMRKIAKALDVTSDELITLFQSRQLNLFEH